MGLDQVHNVFNQFVLCNQEGARCDGIRLLRSATCNDMISTNSPEAQTIADSIEDGWSERQAVAIVKKNLFSLDPPFIAHNQLCSVAQRMKPVASAAQKAKQGSSDLDAP